ncbi:MAG: glycoside hydrolase family 65 protein, partial [Pseudomonadota bacterium]
MTGDEWSITWRDIDAEAVGLIETLTTLGNGRFATRGARIDARADDVNYPGTYLAGGYNRAITTISGQPIENEDLVNWPNWLAVTVEGPSGSLADAEVIERTQSLDMRGGTLLSVLRLRDQEGRTTTLTERRMVSMANPLLAASSLEIRAEDWSGQMRIESFVDGRVRNTGVPRYRALEGHHFDVTGTHNDGDAAILLCQTRQSGIDTAIAARSQISSGGEILETQPLEEAEIAGVWTKTHAHAGSIIKLEKVIAFVTERDHAIASPAIAAREEVRAAGSFEDMERAHRREMDALWHDFDIAMIDGSSDAQSALRFQLFHLMQSLSPHTAELDAGAPARGWHGEAYRGHIFWDEMFIFRVLNLRAPRLTRELLRYRHRRLPAARKLAQAEGLPGAMYPWQSGSDGREETQTLHLNPRSGRWVRDATNRQRHVGLAIAYNVLMYYRATNDLDFMIEAGAEMLGEIARLFTAMASWDESIGRYRLRGVMGPDEFHTGHPDADQPEGLDDNAYTNVLCAWMLARTLDLFASLPTARREHLMATLAIEQAELERWLDVSERLHVPFMKNGLLAQFDGYEDLEELDWEGYRRKYGDIHRLDRILEAEGKSPNKYKMSKQADVLMLPFLFTAESLRETFEQLGYTFDTQDLPRLVEYYGQRTSHGSTLSTIVQAWVVARTDRTKSWDLFSQALRADLEDVQGGTTREGIHLGAMCGTI